MIKRAKNSKSGALIFILITIIMSKTTILVTSASGNTSNAVARHLLARVDKDKVNVRVGARSKDKIQDLIKKGAEYVKFDFFDKNSIVEALKGVDRLWVTIPNPPKEDQTPLHTIVADFIDLVAESKVQHIVFGTIETGLNITLCREFNHVEERIQKYNIPATFLRMGWFMENVITYHSEELKQNTYVDPIDDHAFTQISVEDIGRAAAAVLAQPEGKAGKSYSLTGPKAVTGAYIAQLLTEILGREIKFVSPSLEETAEGLRPYMSEDLVKTMIELSEVIRADLVVKVTNDFTELTGLQYLSIEERFKQLNEAGLLV